MKLSDRKNYEEPKLRWYIGSSGVVHKEKTTLYSEPREIIGNSFETEEEAEKALEKIKAFKRLKDKGFRFRWIDMQTGQIKYSFFLKKGQKLTREYEDDLLLLFGGKE